ncbi:MULTISPECIES: S-layer homology domain-containing protein [Bacillus cereus group]|uniref:S-layer homology domain-containing protein n=1 Tax=Bacillus cereus group TaxID=86661 RepID=UPI001F37B754|nr:S-layer homology domain-containing protein [Bacillus cereus]MDA1521240.1 S-layer homology domain-containing protein [Bacillus cereus]BCC09339.1 hypothetical protein BCM0060_p2005 [Bacillus cereus]BCC16549.1 hypothetical protein BCM0075_1319 [Bacillus cereus]BCD08744.1 hypothetical protein BC30052_p2026 [Bacillus cereus]HDR7981613.1 S-layer homology domain-containing protein [Bacillus cereus]
MNFKNVLATGLITATLFGSTTTTHAQTTSFNDVPNGHWSEEAINYLAEKGFVSGYGNGMYGFGDNVTRGQVASIMARYFNLNNNGSTTTQFTDIQGHMFENSIKAVTQSGIMVGDGTDKFRPDDILNRYEMAAILKHAFDLAVKGNMPFSDIPNGHWAKDAIQALYTNGVTSGVGYNEYGGQYSVTREQFATFMYKSIFKDQNQKPVDKQSDMDKLKRVAEENGFFYDGKAYTYNIYGKDGHPSYEIMDLIINNGSEWETKMFIYSSDPVLDNKIKALLNVLVPTQKDYLFDIVNTKGPKTQTFELDGRTVKVTRQAGINIFFGAKK